MGDGDKPGYLELVERNNELLSLLVDQLTPATCPVEARPPSGHLWQHEMPSSHPALGLRVIIRTTQEGMQLQLELPWGEIVWRHWWTWVDPLR